MPGSAFYSSMATSEKRHPLRHLDVGDVLTVLVKDELERLGGFVHRVTTILGNTFIDVRRHAQVVLFQTMQVVHQTVQELPEFRG